MDREYSGFAAMQLWVETRKGGKGVGDMGAGVEGAAGFTSARD